MKDGVQFMIQYQHMESKHGKELMGSKRMNKKKEILIVIVVIIVVILLILILMLIRMVIIKEVMRIKILRVINSLIQIVMKHRIQVKTRIQVIKTQITIQLIKAALIPILKISLSPERKCHSNHHLLSNHLLNCPVITLQRENT